ncbi:MAG: DUF5678 domain-containing protein [Dehalococcoidia bacterium]
MTGVQRSRMTGYNWASGRLLPTGVEGERTMASPSLERVREGLEAAQAEQEYWNQHYGELLAKYAEQFVAVKDGEVVAAEDDLGQLILVLSTKNIDIRDMWVRFVTADASKLLL